MVVLLAYAITLLAAVLISGIARKTALSLTVMFLIAGFLVGPGALGLFSPQQQNINISAFVEVTLASVLFVDGMKVEFKRIVQIWELPTRALLLGLPLTLALMAVPAHFLFKLSWPEAFLIGAALSPTDPVFASILVSRKEVPEKLRELLNIESGLNDGLALPIILTLLAYIHSSPPMVFNWISELAIGVAIGIAVPGIVLSLDVSRFFSITGKFRPLLVVAIGLLVYALAKVTSGNVFLAAYSAGITVVTISREHRDDFMAFGEQITELLKLAALLIFGAMISIQILKTLTWYHVLYAVLVLLVARPLGLGIALIGSKLSWPERLTAAWFGPRGFASVVYGILIFSSGVPDRLGIFIIIATVIIISIFAHSSTDSLVADWFDKRNQAKNVDEATAG